MLSLITKLLELIWQSLAKIFAQKKSLESVKIEYSTYADEKQDVRAIFDLAMHNLFIVVSIGNGLLSQYRSDIEKMLSKGVTVNILVQTEKYNREAVRYVRGKYMDESFLQSTYDVLNEYVRMQNGVYCGKISIREFDDIMTASYVCNDVFTCERDANPNAAIQTMLYQYHMQTSDSPISYITRQHDKETYDSTIKCLKKMWRDSTPIVKERMIQTASAEVK